MKLLFLLLLPAVCFSQINVQDYPVYTGKDLGVNYTATKTIFIVWAPKATSVKLRLYKAGADGEAINTVDLNKEQKGIWQTEINKDIKNQYYTFLCPCWCCEQASDKVSPTSNLDRKII